MWVLYDWPESDHRSLGIGTAAAKLRLQIVGHNLQSADFSLQSSIGNLLMDSVQFGMMKQSSFRSGTFVKTNSNPIPSCGGAAPELVRTYLQ